MRWNRERHAREVAGDTGDRARRGPLWLGLACLWPALVACGGAGAGAPDFDDARFLRFGVDPVREADALQASLAEAGRRVVLREVGQRFAALGIRDQEGDGTGVRIITTRGIRLAFDAGARHGAPDLRLSLWPFAGDADGDGRAEIFVAGDHEAAGQRCIQGYRVRDDGHLQTLALRGPDWPDPLCVSTLRDLDGDGHLDGLVHLPLWDLARHEPPVARVPVWLQEAGFVFRRDARTARWLQARRAELTRRISQARRALDAERAYRYGVESAAYAYFAGEPRARQVACIDEALRGLVLSGPQARAHLHARRYVGAGWRRPPVVQEGATW